MDIKTYSTTEAARKAQKKYNEKRKKVACEVDINFFDIITENYKQQGFKSANSYVLHLITEDLKKHNITLPDQDWFTLSGMVRGLTSSIPDKSYSITLSAYFFNYLPIFLILLNLKNNW